MDDWDDMLGYNGDLRHDMMVDYIIDDDEDDMNRRGRHQAFVPPAARRNSGGGPDTLDDVVRLTRLMIARQHWRIEDLEERINKLEAALVSPGLSAKRRDRANDEIAKCRAEIDSTRGLLSVYKAQLSSLLTKRKRTNVAAIALAACLIALIVGLLLFL